MNLSKFMRRTTCEVRIGRTTIGGGHPVACQSMTNTDTNDTAASVAQIERIDRAGGKIVRLTAQGRREGENLENIVRQLRADGFRTAVVADIHFVPEVAAIAARYVDKVRVNPGNYRLDRGDLQSLIAQCRERGVALRVGVNHGSLAKRVFDEWGDTPQGMVVSAMEFLRVCRECDFDQVVVSMKSSNTRVMVAAYRLLVEAMDAEDMHYPIHLGVTEAGNGIEIRSQVFTGFSRYPRCGEIVCGVWPRVVSIGHLLASDIQAGSVQGSGEVEFPKVGTIAASEKFYQPCAFVMYEGLASCIEAGSEADSGAKIYPMCSPALRCSGTTYMTEGGEADAENTHSGRH